MAQEITGETSDGYHTFNELYEHRCLLFVLLVNSFSERLLQDVVPFKTHKNDKGEEWPGWFIAGMETPFGQISYHLPDSYWDLLDKFRVREWDYNRHYDGHTSNDVIDRLKKLLTEV